MENGIRAKVSSFSRHFPNAKMTRGKTCGDYVNSILAKREALLDGYDEAIMLDTQGFVAEASGENIFAVLDLAAPSDRSRPHPRSPAIRARRLRRSASWAPRGREWAPTRTRRDDSPGPRWA